MATEPPSGPVAADMDDVETPPWRLMRLLDGYVTTQLLYVAAKLEIASVLAEGPKAVVAAFAFSGIRRLVDVGGGRGVITRVVHDWDDADARRILASCRAAMRPDETESPQLSVGRHAHCATAACSGSGRRAGVAPVSRQPAFSGRIAASSGRNEATERAALRVDAFCGRQRARLVVIETTESRHPPAGLGVVEATLA